MEEELKQLKTVLRSLVVSSPSQVDVRSLMRDYRNMMGQQIPLSKFGFRDPVTFLKKHFTDCFLFQGPDSNPILTLIVPETLKHIDQFVQRQKPSQSAKIKGKRRSVNETVLKNSMPAKNLIATTYQVQKTIEKETLTHKGRIVQNKTYYKAEKEPARSENRNVTNSTNNLACKKKSNHSSKTQNNTEFKSDDQKRQISKTNPVHTINEGGEEKNYRTAKTCISDKENDTLNEQSHSSAYLNFRKKRMPFVNVNTAGKSDYSDTEDSYSSRQLSCSTSSSKRAQLEELQKELSEMVLQEPGGILCTELMRKYRQKYGRELDFARFGYTSVLSVAVSLAGCAAHELQDDWLLIDERVPPPRPTPRPTYRAPTRDSPVDPEDALPFIDFEPDVFPPDCMHYMDSIPPPDLGGVEAGDMLEVMVGEVYSPSHFWLIRLGEDYDIAMENLMDEMNSYFKSESGQGRRLALGAVRAGHYCCSCYCGDWHRSLIVKVLDSDTVKVRHVDYGTVETVRAAELRPLLRAWSSLPAQAVRARLAAAAPPAAARRWPRAAAARFLAAVTDKRLVANVVARDHQEDILEVVLIDTSTEEDVSIGELLVRAGHADPRAEPATGTDAAYLYPVFGALEAGDTPNYAEIQAYLRNGIALDYVEEYRRHVPAAAPPRTPAAVPPHTLPALVPAAAPPRPPTALVSPRHASDPPPSLPLKPAPANLTTAFPVFTGAVSVALVSATTTTSVASASVAPASVAPASVAPVYVAPTFTAPAFIAPVSNAPNSTTPISSTVSTTTTGSCAPVSTTTEPEAVTLSAADCEVFALLSEMDAVVAQRFMMWAIQRRQNLSAPLNPLAPEFPAPPRTPAPSSSTAITSPARSVSVQVIKPQETCDAVGDDGRASAPPSSGEFPPAQLRPSRPSFQQSGYPPAPRYPPPMVFRPRFSPGWGPPAGYGPPHPPVGFGPNPIAGFPPYPPAGYGSPSAAHPYAHMRPPPGFERFY